MMEHLEFLFFLTDSCVLSETNIQWSLRCIIPVKCFCWKVNSFLWGLHTLQISHRLKFSFNLMTLDKLCFLIRGLLPADSTFSSKIRLKLPAKITFLLWKSSQSFNKLFRFFMVVNCSYSVLALWKFIRR